MSIYERLTIHQDDKVLKVAIIDEPESEPKSKFTGVLYLKKAYPEPCTLVFEKGRLVGMEGGKI